MPTHLLHSRLAAAIPLIPVLLLIAAFLTGRDPGSECVKGKPCPRDAIAALFQVDETVRVDPTGAIIPARAKPIDPSKGLTPEKVHTDSVSARQRMLASAARRISARYVWTFFVGAGFLTSLAAVAVAAVLVARGPDEQGAPYAVHLAAVLVPAAGLGLLLYNDPDKHMRSMKEVLNASVAHGGALGRPEAVGVINALSAVQLASAVALLLALCVALLPTRLATAVQPGESARDTEQLLRAWLRPITHRMKKLRMFLYIATVMLVVGVLRIQTSMDWALTFVTPEDAQALAGLGSTMPSVIGALFSLMLAMVYLPSTYILHERAEALIAEAGVPAEVKDEIRGSSVLSHSLGATLPRIAALMGPLLAGPFASLLERL